MYVPTGCIIYSLGCMRSAGRSLSNPGLELRRETPFVQVCTTWVALTCPKQFIKDHVFMRDIETWLLDSRVCNNSVIDHRRPVLSPLLNCVNKCNVCPYWIACRRVGCSIRLHTQGQFGNKVQWKTNKLNPNCLWNCNSCWKLAICNLSFTRNVNIGLLCLQEVTQKTVEDVHRLTAEAEETAA